MAALDVRPVYPCVCADEAVFRLRYYHSVAHPDDSSRLSQNQLHELRFLSEVIRDSHGASRRLDALESYDSPLGLRDDLLLHDDYVVLVQRPAGGSEGADYQLCDIVILPHLGNPVKRMDGVQTRLSWVVPCVIIYDDLVNRALLPLEDKLHFFRPSDSSCIDLPR